MARKIRAVVHATVKSHVKLNKKALQVKKGMTDNAATFPGTAVDVTKLSDDQALYATYIAGAKGNTVVKAQRNSMALVILDDLQKLLPPVNIVANGDPAIIAQAGFDSSADPTPHSIPKQVVIKRMVNGAENQTAKIYIEAMGQSGLTFQVRITTVPNAASNDPSWVLVLQTTSSKKLIIPNLTRGKEVFIQINAMNAAGIGIWSDAKPFILQ